VGFFTFGPFRIRINANIIRAVVRHVVHGACGASTGGVDIDIFVKMTTWQMMIGKMEVGSLSWF
jgi:hypothetical protein